MNKMISRQLQQFADTRRRGKRMSFADVRKLQRDLLPDGIATREEAELLIGLDRAIGDVHPTWAGYLVGAVVEFVVWGSRPTGCIDQETARWLVSWLKSDGPTGTAQRIAREAIDEAHDVHGSLKAAVRKSRPGASARIRHRPARDNEVRPTMA
jgi:hypothetical protein